MINDTTIRVSKDLREFLKKQGAKGQSYEDIIWNLIGAKQVTNEFKKQFGDAKKSYEASL